MAETSGIAWTRSTYNPWIGCTAIGPGCVNCYAEQLDKRMRYGGDTHWGDDKPRFRTSPEYLKGPYKWEKAARIERESGKVLGGKWHTPGFWPVFCASLADVFDNRVPQEWRDDLWQVITDTPNLSWLLVTKRIGNVKYMVPAIWPMHRFPPNIRILITVTDQDEADRDIPKLLELRCKNGISYEPALGPVDWMPWLYPTRTRMQDGNQPKLEWIIVGGESTQGGQARPFNVKWAYSTIAQCKAGGCAVFVKQMGSHVITSDEPGAVTRHLFRDRAGADPSEWNADLRYQEFPQ